MVIVLHTAFPRHRKSPSMPPGIMGGMVGHVLCWWFSHEGMGWVQTLPPFLNSSTQSPSPLLLSSLGVDPKGRIEKPGLAFFRQGLKKIRMDPPVPVPCFSRQDGRQEKQVRTGHGQAGTGRCAGVCLKLVLFYCPHSLPVCTLFPTHSPTTSPSPMPNATPL